MDLLKETAFHLLFEGRHVVVARNLLDVLLDCWDERLMVFNIKGRRLSFTEQDVALITGLRASGEIVNWKSPDGKLLAPEGSFYRKFFSTRRPDRQSIEELLDKCLRGVADLSDDDMVRIIVLHMFSTTLFTQSSRTVPTKLCDYLDDLSQLSKYNWPGAIHKMLVSKMSHSSRCLHSRSSGETSSGGTLAGAAYVLQVSPYIQLIL